MPGKGRRVAARQSQLGQRRRRQNKNSPSSQSIVTAVDSTEYESRSVNPSTTPESQSPNTASVFAAQPAVRSLAPTSLAHNYVKAELIRIVAMGSVLILALVGLSFLI